jgi:tetratricopeptide (TPR) repeat protein
VVAVGLIIAACGWNLGCADRLGDARTLEGEGDYLGAVGIYQEALEEDPDDLEALEGLASDLMLLGRYDEAVALQERVVTLDPDDVQTRIDLGFNYLNHQDRATDAMRVLGEAARLDRSAKNLTFLAQAQIVCGDLAGAESSLGAAIELDATYERSYSVLAALLTDEGRTDEAAQVVERAEQQGITITGSY